MSNGSNFKTNDVRFVIVYIRVADERVMIIQDFLRTVQLPSNFREGSINCLSRRFSKFQHKIIRPIIVSLKLHHLVIHMDNDRTHVNRNVIAYAARQNLRVRKPGIITRYFISNLMVLIVCKDDLGYKTTVQSEKFYLLRKL